MAHIYERTHQIFVDFLPFPQVFKKGKFPQNEGASLCIRLSILAIFLCVFVNGQK
jgi:hypothetical protein